MKTRKTVLDRGPRSDRPRFCVTTSIRAGHWSLTLTYDLDFQSQVSYGHDPRTQKLKFKSQSAQKIEWKQTDGQTYGQTDDATDCFSFPVNAVSNNDVERPE